MTVLCESERTSPDGTRDFYRIAHTWNTDEQSMLPIGQIMRLHDIKISKNNFPFAPDGMFKERDRVIIFKNKTDKNDFLEAVLPPSHS